MKVANRPDYTECLNETATNRDPCKNQNSISNPSIVIGDTNVQSISRVNSPMLLALHKSPKKHVTRQFGSPEPIMNLVRGSSGETSFAVLRIVAKG